MPEAGGDCKPGRSDLSGRGAAETGVRSDVVVVLLPGGQNGPGVRQRREQRLVQAFIPKPPVEAFHEAILHRLAGGDVVPLDPVLLAPAQDRHAGQLGPVVAVHQQRRAAAGDQGIELTDDAGAGQRGVGHRRQALAREVVHHRQDPKAPPVAEAVGDEVQRPALVWPLRQGHRRPCAQGALAPPPRAPAHLELLLPVFCGDVLQDGVV